MTTAELQTRTRLATLERHYLDEIADQNNLTTEDLLRVKRTLRLIREQIARSSKTL